MRSPRVASLAEVARIAAEEGSHRFALRDFLDGFYQNPSPSKLCDEPPLLAGTLSDGEIVDAFLAACCDHLCRLHRLPSPHWILSEKRMLRKPHFAATTHGLCMILLQESPPAFRERNIFVSANALSRA